MRIFFVGGFEIYADYEKEKLLQSYGVRDRLISYAFLKDGKYVDTFQQVLQNRLYDGVMIDSGAFTEAYKGVKIDTRDYFKFVQNFKFDFIIGPDKIPVRKEGWFEGETFEEAAEITMHRCLSMREAGVDNIPTYHQGEPVWYLKKYCDEFPMVAISLSSKRFSSIGVQMANLDRCFDVVPKTTKVHGLAITDFKLPSIYPFYSVDSNTWQREARYGKIKIKLFDKFATLGLTEGLLYSVPRHYELTTQEVRDECDRYLAEEFHTTVKNCREDIFERYRVNVAYYNEMLRIKRDRTHKQIQLF